MPPATLPTTPSDAPRLPLGLPRGSVRALIALMIVMLFWLLLLLPDSNPPVLVPLNLYFLLGLVLLFYASHGKTIASAADDEQSPLYLPGGVLRILMIVGSAAVLVFTEINHPERMHRLTPPPDELKHFTLFLGALLGGFFLGIAVRVIPGRDSWLFQGLQAWLALIAMLALVAEVVIQAFVKPTLAHEYDLAKWQAVVTALAAAYYGTRS